jgi:hypothetical protein
MSEIARTLKGYWSKKTRGEMKKQSSGILAEGRIPPPAEKRFLKGRSGNLAGRPKGSIGRSRITRKVMRKKHSVHVQGKLRRLTTLELLILKAQAMAASGHPGAASLINWLRSEIEPPELDSAEGGFALVPAAVTPEEFEAQAAAGNAGKLEPGTFVDVKSEEYMKAVRGEPSPLGEALRAFNKKYGAGPPL